MTWRRVLWSALLTAFLLGLAYVVLLVGTWRGWSEDRLGIVSGSLAFLAFLVFGFGVFMPLGCWAFFPIVRRMYREDELPHQLYRFFSPSKRGR